MLRQFWQRLKRFFQQLFGTGRRRQTSPLLPEEYVKSLSDAGYERLFLQLLDGVAEGWKQPQVLEHLGKHREDKFFKSWLSRFGRDRLLGSPLPHHELAMRMVRLGEIGCGDLGAIALDIGQKLLERESQPLTEGEYESLFGLLLEKVPLGQAQVLKFMEDLEYRGTGEQWVPWLRDYGDRLLEASRLSLQAVSQESPPEEASKISPLPLPLPNISINELASRMVQLGEEMRSLPSYQELGKLATEIGNQLAKEGDTVLPSLNKEVEVAEAFSLENTENINEESGITLDEFLVMLQQDTTLVEQLADELQIKTNDPQVIIKALQAEAFFQNGVEQVVGGEVVAAIASIESALALRNDNHLYWIARGDLLRDVERYDEAVDSYDRALAIKPDDREALSKRGELAVNGLSVKFSEGQVAGSNNSTTTFPVFPINFARNASPVPGILVAELPDNPDDAEAWFERGKERYRKGDLLGAVASCDRAITINPEYYEAWNNRGASLASLGRFQEAIASYDRAVAIKADYHFAWYNRGVSLKNLKRYEEAIASIDCAIDITKNDNPLYWAARGEWLRELGRYEEAVASYDRSLAIKPDDPEVSTKREEALRLKEA